ncbi:MAG TPA: ice-binding family protein [Burkholderiales bacterium]|nr:ice-binding family protein [Burkholderiales bacterium]
MFGCGGGGGGAGVGASDGPTGAACTGADCVNIGTAGNYAILAKTGVSTVPNSVVTGNVGLSPAARTGLTGWALVGEPTDTYFTSAQVASPGKLYAADNVGGSTTADLTTAVGDMEAAYTAAAAKPAGPCPGAGALGGLTLVPGVYTCALDVSLASGTNLVLSGTGVWVFQITGNLTQAAATQVQLTGGALPQNVFWQVSGTVAIDTTALMQGVILGKTLIALQQGAEVRGRLLAQTAVTLNQNTVTKP